MKNYELRNFQVTISGMCCRCDQTTSYQVLPYPEPEIVETLDGPMLEWPAPGIEIIDGQQRKWVYVPEERSYMCPFCVDYLETVLHRW